MVLSRQYAKERDYLSVQESDVHPLGKNNNEKYKIVLFIKLSFE
jgi:hypothetical protein